MLLLLPFVIASSFFGKIRGGNFIFRLCGYWADCWFFLIGIRHQNIYETQYDKSKHFIFVANHSSYLDAAILVKSMKQPMRVLGKIEMTKIPLFGFIYRKAVVTVDRSNSDNRAKSVEILKSVINKGISIFIFPEGTFNLTSEPLKEFYDGAFRIAIETRVPIKPVLFLDACQRMNYKSIFSLNPGKSRSVFLEEISVEGYDQKDIELLKQKVYNVMDQKLRAYKAACIK
ncbi:MAG: lysophospholipid acyltransferase family protein [Chitinophagaceae bacterium]